MSLLETSKTYSPSYMEVIEITKLHEGLHWFEDEVKLQQDVEQWKLGKITDEEKKFVNSILRLFTQSDVAVGSDYYDNLIPVFKNNEVRNMLGSFAAREGVHQRAYALLNDTLGFGEGFYSEFLDYKEMKAKVEFMLDMKNDTVRNIALSLAKQVMAEGVMLFASFAMLLNFQRRGLLMGMGDVNAWSIRDESVHVRGVAYLFTQLLKENPGIVDDAFKYEIYEAARQVVVLEDSFVELAFKAGKIEGITEQEVKDYIRVVTDYRMQQLGFKPSYNLDNPFPWLDWITSSNMVENFFEANTTGYSKNSMVGDFSGGY